MYTFAENFKNIRMVKGMTQAEVARKLGLHRQTVNNWEKKNVTPDIKTLKEIAELMECSVAFLLGNSKADPPVHFFKDKQIEEILNKLNNLDLDELRDVHSYIDYLRFKNPATIQKESLYK